MKLIHVIGTLDPTWGGPVAALTHLSRATQEMGFEPQVATLDSPEKEWLSHFPGHVHALGPSRGRYRYTRRLAPWLDSNLGSFDGAIVHGIWQYQSVATRSAARKQGVPYAVCVHGGLAPWLNQRYPLKRVKKQLYWPLIEYKVFRDARTVLFACEEEQRKAHSAVWPYRAEESVASFGVPGPGGDVRRQRDAFFAEHPALEGKRLLLFLGRLHPVKGCDLLIEAFAAVRDRDARLHLVMAGPDEVGWRSGLMALAGDLGVEDCITWTGMLTGDAKWGAFHAADAFVLPSHSESFGMSVAEALSCGVPVLLTTAVGVWREVLTDGAGLAEPDTRAGVARLLRRWLTLDPDHVGEMRSLARESYATRFELHSAASRFLGTIQNSLNPVPTPADASKATHTKSVGT